MANTISHMTSTPTLWIRAAWALLAALLLGFCIYLSAQHGWPVGGTMLAFAIAPDLTLIGAFDPDHRGRVRPSRVAAYNAAHRIWIPLILGVVGAFLSIVYLAAALAWMTHIAVDRAVGYGLRAADGSIRPVGGTAASTPCSA